MRVGRRPLPWVASTVYAAVLVAGVSFQLGSGSPPARTAAFGAVLLALLGLEAYEQRRYPRATRPGLAVVLLGVRAVLFVVASTLDSSGFSRALFLLIPYSVYFAFGRRIGLAVAGGCLLAIGASVARTPGWYRDAESLSDLVMFTVGLVFAVGLAAAAAQVAAMAAANERTRVARDIHDSLGHHLTAASVQLEKAATFRDREPDAAAQALADARQSVRFALEDVRLSVAALRDGSPFSLATSVDALVRGLRSENVTVELSITGSEDGFARPVLVALYRAAQEAVTNARRHAAANAVSVRVDLDDAGGRLLVADDGRGFDPGAPDRGGFGLRGLRERLDLVGGSLGVESAPGGGTRLTVSVPRRAVGLP
jgi:signal transduction histidine kinase